MANYEGTDLFVKPCNMIRENRGGEKNNVALLICYAPISFKLKAVDL